MERLLGIAHVQHHADPRGLEVEQVDLFDLERQDAPVDDTGLALNGGDGDLLPVGELLEGACNTYHSRDTELTGYDGRVRSTPPPLGDDS